jgi:regulator of sirC expression with transglutaminase-like and TPR domain
MTPLTFLQEIEGEPINLARAALRFSEEIRYPALNVDGYLAQIDYLAEDASRTIQPGENPLILAEQLAHYLFDTLAFWGNSQDYHDPRNSYLNEVLDRRLGLPISLSVVFLSLAEHLGLPAQGIGLPGHFIVSVQGVNGPLFLDPFHRGRILSVIDCARLVEISTGYSGPFQPNWLAPVGPREIITRMLYNLRNVYIQQNEWGMALKVVERLLALQPDKPDLLRDLGTIHRETGALRAAIEYYQRYLQLAPAAPDAALVRRNLQETARLIAIRN